MKASEVDESARAIIISFSLTQRFMSLSSWKFASKREHRGSRSFANHTMALAAVLLKRIFHGANAALTSTLLKQMCNSVARTSFTTQAGIEDGFVCFR
jgi:hypothetical protein